MSGSHMLDAFRTNLTYIHRIFLQSLLNNTFELTETLLNKEQNSPFESTCPILLRLLDDVRTCFLNPLSFYPPKTSSPRGQSRILFFEFF